jgi:hypothetical protein
VAKLPLYVKPKTRINSRRLKNLGGAVTLRRYRFPIANRKGSEHGPD